MTLPTPADVKKLAKSIAEPFKGDIEVWTPEGDGLDEFKATPATVLIRAPRSTAEIPEVWGITPLYINGKLETYWLWNTYNDYNRYRTFAIDTIGDDINVLRSLMHEISGIEQ